MPFSIYSIHQHLSARNDEAHKENNLPGSPSIKGTPTTVSYMLYPQSLILEAITATCLICGFFLLTAGKQSI